MLIFLLFLIGGGPKLGMQQHWFPLEPGSSFGLGNPVPFLLFFSFLEDSGYPHDGRADKNPYPHDRCADKDFYPYDSNNQFIILRL